MAVRKPVKKQVAVEDSFVPERVVEEQAPVSKKSYKGWIYLLVALGLLVYFWYKTDTWPIIGMVGTRPITRFEVDKALFKQGGTQVVDDIVTRSLVEEQLRKDKIRVSSEEIDAKIEELRKSLGQGVNLEEKLKQNGWTLDDVKKQMALQMAIEKAVKDRITITTEEVQKYIKDYGSFLTGKDDASKSAEAEKALKSQKLQEAVSKWIEGIRKAGKVWYLKDSYKAPTPVQ